VWDKVWDKVFGHAAHGDDFLLQVHVLHPQPQQFHQTKAAAVHDLRHEQALPLQTGKKPG
jgi:hypothetical protein